MDGKQIQPAVPGPGIDTTAVRLAGQLGGTEASPDVRGIRETGSGANLTLGAVLDGQYLKRSGTTLLGAASGGGTFGTEYQYAASEAESSTGSGTWQQKLKMTTPSLPVGNYLVEFCASVRTGDIIEVRFHQDDTTVLADCKKEIPSTAEKHAFAAFKEVALNGVHDFDVDFRQTGGTGTGWISKVRIKLWRVS